MAAPDLATAQWHISSYSAHNGTCVEVGTLADGHIAIRNSNRPTGCVVIFSPAEMAAFLGDVKTGDLGQPRA